LSAMDVFVLPSLFEGLPMVAIEAQANGLKCILADTITKETALSDAVAFCALDDTVQWIDALYKVKTNDLPSRALAEELYNKMSLTELAKELEQYYTK
ncbi:MAG: glycosyltransferase, partial [Peptococcaceae bacterium]|nr:glycosyltransferase [Peptococcaceae bacterium]